MSGILTITTSCDARYGIRARVGRIEALAEFARLGCGVRREAFVAVLNDAILWQAYRVGIQSTADIALRAWRHFEAEIQEAVDDPSMAEEIDIYLASLVGEAATLGIAHRRLSRDGADHAALPMDCAVQIYLGTSGANVIHITVDVLADLFHWSHANGLDFPAGPWT